MENRVDVWLEKLTLKEKARLCAGADLWSTIAVERLGIPSLFMADGPNGIRKEQNDVLLGGAAPATCFPTASALGSSWNTGLLHEIGRALGKECNRLGVDLLLGPGINMKRSPLCGRNFEYYSEDPFLSGELGAAFVTGVQSQKVGATLKHYACNNTEFERMTINSEVDERTLREIYLAAFERIVKKANPWAIMSAYNKVNGTYVSENNYLLNDILRNEWGFQGIVMSDWLAVNDRVNSVEAGLNLEMPGPADSSCEQIIEAVHAGRLDVSTLDNVVRNLLSVIESVSEPRKMDDEWNFDDHHLLAQQAAEECIVLLKNDRQILPLDPKQIASIAVVGKFALSPLYQGEGSAKVNPTRLDVPLEELRNIVGSGSDLQFAQGYLEEDEPNEELLIAAVSLAKEAEVALLFVGIPQGEACDRTHIDLPANQINLIKAVAAVQSNCVVIINAGSAVGMDAWIEAVPVVVDAWMPGQAGGGAVAKILFGLTNPSGKLSETFPVKLSDNPSYLNFPGENGKTLYGEGLFIGYRYYDKKEIEPLFPFGHGLSYTSFEYTNLTCDRKQLKDSDPLTVTIDITNTGDCPGMEIVQLYIHDQACRWVRPEKELKSFAKVALDTGVTKTVSFVLNPRDFCYYDSALKMWTTDTGYFTIMVGSSSRDIRLSVDMYMEITCKPMVPMNENHPIKDWLNTKTGRDAIQYIGEHHVKDQKLKNDILNHNMNAFYLQMPIYKFIKLLSSGDKEANFLMDKFF
ncbi:glycosyl hydrolase [Paenibacillus sp. SYP-B3998]|uniref:Glycosyl hydrolase n=1 Tax=Paenibacillus sp. SYP-B3998 TaxID=2678564 RepID=A0A6G3ZZH1_9BACL|nr:glycoside hydrolase family 3 C-terminal domain-containing protein [Paenibacillus sp. SYP-B3998]NEW06979.1 glycosyl hydrolase [Paenibacillus sp. SYP-B3998]